MPQVAMILDVEHKAPWLQNHDDKNFMDTDMPTGHLIIIADDQFAESMPWIQCELRAENGSWYVNRDSIEILGEL